MPELPEVQTVASDLNKVLVNKTLLNIEVVDPKILNSSLKILKKEILKKKVKAVKRRAKMIIVDFGDHYLLFHLKMTGQLIFRAGKKMIAGGHPIVSTGVTVPNKFTRLIFNFSDQGKLYFNDIRKFGWVKIINLKNFSEIESSLGYEPLEKSFTLAVFNQLIKRRPKMLVKAFLLDQKLIAGLGNIYVDETLFAAKVRPTRRVKSLNQKEIKKIWQTIPKILRLAVAKRGTTFSNYLDGHGAKGGFVPFLKVYGRGQKDCKVCKKPIKKIRVAGRGTHYCPYCQK